MVSHLRRMTRLLLLVLSVVGVGSPVAQADNVTVQGNVTNAAGRPITGAKVLVEVVASLRSDFHTPPGFWGQRQVVLTNGLGRYIARLEVPETTPNVPRKNRYLRVVVAKLGGQLVRRGGRLVHDVSAMRTALVPLDQTGAIQNYTADFMLDRLTHGAALTGTITDRETGERLRGHDALALGLVANTCGRATTLRTDADGEYFGVLPMCSSVETRQIDFNVDPFATEIFTAPNGVTYEPLRHSGVFTSVKVHTLNVALKRAAAQTAVVGRVIDRVTGQPIPNSLVQGIQGACGVQTYSVWSVTDLFGRYQIKVNTPNCLTLVAHGGFVEPIDPDNRYQFQHVDLSGKVPAGQVSEVDFSLAPR